LTDAVASYKVSVFMNQLLLHVRYAMALKCY
jgi:hypothetical protein